ncbi:MAG: Ig-like domain-containing protein [Synergistaceae bacterium]|nr:Ig-like domain-containing protein [Synergistaceae bacterium]
MKYIFCMLLVVLIACPVMAAEDLTLNMAQCIVDLNNTCTVQLSVETPAGQNAIWMSSNPSIATVDYNGLVTCLDSGEVIIKATAAGQTAECAVSAQWVAP